ncbi:MAG: tetratricopeptide repeat protein [Bacteroidota bacterium]
MPFDIKGYRIFIASPSGLEEERRAFFDQVNQYNIDEAKFRNVIFEPVGWEATLPGIGRPQSLINEDIRKCDYFILMLHNRWGSSPGENDFNATSACEEEYKLAWKCIKDKGLDMKQLICLFKAVDEGHLIDPGKQLSKVIEFKRTIEQEKKLLYVTFSSIDEFKNLIRKNLAKWLRDDNSIRLDPKPYKYSDEDITDSIAAEPKNAYGAEYQKEEGKMIDNAWKLANEGSLIDAEIEFSKAIIQDPSGNTLLEYSKFLRRLGQVDKAKVMINRAIKIAEFNEDSELESKSLTMLALIQKTRGDIYGAKEMHKKALDIFQKIGLQEGMASSYGYLGLILRTHGDLYGAEDMFKKALKINTMLDRRAGMAADYGNLGLILRIRGDMDGAEDMFKKALEMNTKLGLQEGMATDYGNLGLILKRRDDLDGAEEMHKKALEIEKKLGHQAGMAADYGNLGLILKRRGDLDGAEEMLKKSLEINERLDRKAGLATDYGNLGLILRLRGELEGAEKMIKKALEINERLGRKVGIANQYGNLGQTHMKRGDLDAAEEMFKKCIEIAEKCGFSDVLRIALGHLKELNNLRGK